METIFEITEFYFRDILISTKSYIDDKEYIEKFKKGDIVSFGNFNFIKMKKRPIKGIPLENKYGSENRVYGIIKLDKGRQFKGKIIRLKRNLEFAITSVYKNNKFPPDIRVQEVNLDAKVGDVVNVWPTGFVIACHLSKPELDLED